MQKQKILTGWAVADITPSEKTATGGYPDSRLGHWKNDPIQATAMAIRPEGGEMLIWVTLDMVSLGDDVIAELVTHIQKKIPGFKREQLLISTTHPHTAPSVGFVYGEYLDICPDAYEEFTRRLHAQGAISPTEYKDRYFMPLVSDVCAQAAANLAPTGFAPALGHAIIGHCRRVRYKDGTSKMYGETDSENFDRIEGGEDNAVEFLYTYDENDEIKGVVVAVNCPAQSAEIEPFYTADFFGVFRMLLKEQFGREIPVLALCGFAGDLAPRDLPRGQKVFSNLHDNHCGVWFRKDGSSSLENRPEASMWSYEGTKELGRRLMVAFNETAPKAAENIQRELEFAHDYAVLPMALRTVSEKEAMASKAYLDKAVADFDGSIYDAILHLETEFLAEPTAPYRRWQAQRKSPVYNAAVHNLRIGDCAFSTNPFEIYLAFAQRMRARVPAEHVFPIQLTDGGAWYLPTEEAEKAGGYSANIHSQLVKASEGSHLTEFCIAKLNEFFAD